jgi:SOS-response transcriptional repressor LexA
MEHGMILIAHPYGAMFVKNYKVSGGYQVFFMVFNPTFNNILVILWRLNVMEKKRVKVLNGVTVQKHQFCQ